MKRISTDAEYLDSGKLVIDADGIPFEPAAKSYVDRRAPIDSFTGTGSPEGKVAAPVGTVYTDSAATNGAIRWVKTSGTVNTGWRVEYGDTGWRNITSLWSPPPTKGIVAIRRTHAGVDIHFDYTNFPESESTIDLPTSWWTGPTLDIEITRGAAVVGILSASSTGRMTYTSTSTSAPTHILSTTNRYPRSWPESMTGTPL